jgi:2-succinyl-6-hydroxy-2,4-cyclohexadiene-1-carboxylate synthase
MQSFYYVDRLGKLYYLDSDRNNPEVILFLHGFTGSSRDFFSLPQEIIANYRCLIPDLAGHGHTLVREEAVSFETQGQIDLLERWLQSLNVNKCHLFGYSMGGRLALQLATNKSHLIRSLILVSTTAGITNEVMRQNRINADIQLANKILNGDPIDFLTQWLSQPLFRGISDRGRDFLDREVRRRLPIQPSGMACSLKYFSTGIMPCVWHHLKDINVPSLIIAGSRDEKYLSLASQLVISLPNSTLKILETTHAPLIESPSLLWQNVRQFLQANSSKSTPEKH